MNPDAFNRFARSVRELGLPGGNILIAFTAVACGYTLVPAAAGAPDLQVVAQ